MQYELQNYTEEKIQAALDAANIDTAIGLWKAKDWLTYSRTRDALIALLRAGHGEEVRLPHLQFIYFVNSHLLQQFSKRTSDERMFLADSPSSPRPESLVACCGRSVRDRGATFRYLQAE